VHDKDDSEIEGGNPSAAGALSKKEQGGLMVEDLEDSTEPALISSEPPTRKNQKNHREGKREKIPARKSRREKDGRPPRRHPNLHAPPQLSHHYSTTQTRTTRRSSADKEEEQITH
jgi:hypothetical protein